MKVILRKTICFILFIIFVCACKKIDNNEVLKFNFFDPYNFTHDNSIDPDTFAIALNPKAEYFFGTQDFSGVYCYHYQVKNEKIDENKYKTYFIDLYSKNHAILFLNWYKVEKNNLYKLPGPLKRKIHDNFDLANKILKLCEKTKIDIVKIDSDNVKNKTVYSNKFNINNKEVFIQLINCNFKTGKIVINEVVKLNIFKKEEEFSIYDLVKIERSTKKNKEYNLTFKRPSERTTLTLTFTNGLWIYKLQDHIVY